MSRSAHMFGLSWERKPRRGRIFSRPGRDLTPRNNFWQISKTRLPRPLTSPVASLTLRKHCGMHSHPWISCLGLGSIRRRALGTPSGQYPGYNNEIQIAGSDAAIGHKPGINEAEPIASKGDKAFQGKSFVYCLASQSRAATRSRVPTAIAKAHKFLRAMSQSFPMNSRAKRQLSQ